MKILFYDTKKYDKESFDKVLPKYEDIEIEYVDSDISVRNAVYAKGFEAVCGFVSSDFSAKVIDVLADNGVKIILLRCAGFNNVDISRAKERGVLVFRVPGYSPEAVAEHAMALALASNMQTASSARCFPTRPTLFVERSSTTISVLGALMLCAAAVRACPPSPTLPGCTP